MTVSLLAAGPYNSVSREQRAAALQQHPAPPPGLESHRAGLRHEAQRGDSAWGIARDYSQAYHLDISARDVMDANRGAFRGGLKPGATLVIPRVQERIDAGILAEGGPVPASQHIVSRGDTLASLARRYASSTDSGRLSWRELYDANKKAIGPNPEVLREGTVLTIPRTAQPGFAVAPTRTIDQLAGQLLLHKTQRTQRGSDIQQRTTAELRGERSSATRHGSIRDAEQAARGVLSKSSSRDAAVAIVQVRDGAYWAMPLSTKQVASSTPGERVLSDAFRSRAREVVAVLDKDGRNVRVRRFDE